MGKNSGARKGTKLAPETFLAPPDSFLQSEEQGVNIAQRDSSLSASVAPGASTAPVAVKTKGEEKAEYENARRRIFAGKGQTATPDGLQEKANPQPPVPLVAPAGGTVARAVMRKEGMDQQERDLYKR